MSARRHGAQSIRDIECRFSVLMYAGARCRRVQAAKVYRSL
jgi:hypothetical protein